MDEQQLQAAITKLHSTHLTLSISTLLIAVFVLVGGGYFVHRAMQSYEVQLTRAEAQEQQYLTTFKDLQTQLAESSKQRATNDKQIQVIEHTQVVHDQQAAEQIKQVTAPDATADQVSHDVQTFLQITPSVTPDGLFAFSRPETQGIVATRIDRDNLLVKVAAQSTQLGLQQKNTALTEADLKSCKTTLDASNKTIDGYKKAAKKSKFKRFMEGLEKAGLFAAGAYLGHAL